MLKLRFTLLVTLLISLLIVILGFAGCLNSGKLSTVEYNNKIVETLNKTSAAIETTTQIYDSTVPNVVTEEAIIDSLALTASYEAAKKEIIAAETTLTTLKSKNVEQIQNVQPEFTNYITLGKNYLATYETMMQYYSDKSFAENLDKVTEYDNQLHQQYNDFITSNNRLVDILAQYVS